MLTRRQFTIAAGAASLATTPRAWSASGLKGGTLTLGYQKTGIPLVARQLKVFEKRFEPLGIRIEWAEFTSGLNLLQAMDTGDVAFGNAGNVGCIFLQASGGRVAYVAAQPATPRSEGILVKEDSPVRTIADLKGKRIGYAKGSSSHNLVAAALERAGLDIKSVTSIGLSAADAAFAFDGGDIDAWAIWDPYFTIAKRRSPTRVVAYQGDVLPDAASFLLANTEFAKNWPAHVNALVEGSREAGQWAKANPGEVAKAVASATGMPLDVVTEVNANAGFDVVPLSDAILDSQQRTADRLLKVGVLPKSVVVREAVWKA
ncbi:aliphatic sulfonate ABC transporter substrate-binding protein [Variovorax sp. YR216]|uniref:aliphatic sulfonate ABC transporter substrate-binding protein n=1 Tax=Variovorax sp. YR216 TaxID=1882828 RepID=UPI000895BB49|nr:aliphatic sulfonate ABC transporter substrate-binding protein [Variovorax sp. YR216]SEB23566.1 sulfonate transport system substrate-binding protein [Variovorax sp. YR216]